MNVASHLQPYLAAIRENVCSRCVERPPGGPPCLPLGKRCGIEINLEQLVDAVQSVDSPLMDPYIDAFHQIVCEPCPNRNTNHCPCALESLLELAVEAIESVDRDAATP